MNLKKLFSRDSQKEKLSGAQTAPKYDEKVRPSKKYSPEERLMLHAGGKYNYELAHHINTRPDDSEIPRGAIRCPSAPSEPRKPWRRLLGHATPRQLRFTRPAQPRKAPPSKTGKSRPFRIRSLSFSRARPSNETVSHNNLCVQGQWLTEKRGRPSHL